MYLPSVPLTPVRSANLANGTHRCSYKGMAQTSGANTARNITPQATGGFSQIHSRGGGEGGGQAMSVLLSWHEKVRRPNPRPTGHSLYFFTLSNTLLYCARAVNRHHVARLTSATARRNSRPGLHRPRNDGSPHCLSRCWTANTATADGHRQRALLEPFDEGLGSRLHVSCPYWRPPTPCSVAQKASQQ